MNIFFIRTIIKRFFSFRIISRLVVFIFLTGFTFGPKENASTELNDLESFIPHNSDSLFNESQKVTPENATNDENESNENSSAISDIDSHLFSIPEGFEDRVEFWVKIYSLYTSEDAVFHDSRKLNIIYKVVDLREIRNSKIHPFVKEIKIKKLIEKERAQILSRLYSLKKNFKKSKLNIKDQELYTLLGEPKKKSDINEAIGNLRMQIGQKSFFEKALVSSDLYLPTMEKIFAKKGVPLALTRIPFVESSFNLNARSRVGASGIWQIMPSSGRKLIPNSSVDYRNDPIKATEFAASFLKFNYKVTDAWPLAVTAYNHGPTSIARLSKKYKSKDLNLIIQKTYGTHAFGFASSNFYACFLAVLEIEKNRSKYFPDIPKGPILDFSTIQLKKSIKYSELLRWFSNDSKRTEEFNPHLASSIKKGREKIPNGTILYVPVQMSEFASDNFPRTARKI